MKQLLLFFFLLVLFTSCNNSDELQTQENNNTSKLKNGVWRGELLLQSPNVILPFNFEVKEDINGVKTVELINDTERIELGKIRFWNDSIAMPMKIFNTEIRAKIEGDLLSGVWIKNDIKNYHITFSASHNNSNRFILGGKSINENVQGIWKIDFQKGDGSIEMAVGKFRQNGTDLTGTFLTETGDYRFLEGSVDGETFKLSCFDGEHAFLFHATIEGNRLTNGTFWSGKHWIQGWSATKDANAKLPDASTLTYLKDGYKTLEFSFPDLEGNLVSLADDRYTNKVVVIQLMGSWCPNCLDETKFLAPIYKNRKQEGLEVIALAYERLKDRSELVKRLTILKDKIDIEYPILIAGSDDKLDASKTLPMLNHILAFPTTIFVDKKGLVRKIHTGFSGPGTGIHYEKVTRELDLFVDKLLAE